jgi:hypothetical protein
LEDEKTKLSDLNHPPFTAMNNGRARSMRDPRSMFEFIPTKFTTKHILPSGINESRRPGFEKFVRNRFLSSNGYQSDEPLAGVRIANTLTTGGRIFSTHQLSPAHRAKTMDTTDLDNSIFSSDRYQLGVPLKGQRYDRMLAPKSILVKDIYRPETTVSWHPMSSAHGIGRAVSLRSNRLNPNRMSQRMPH